MNLRSSNLWLSLVAAGLLAAGAAHAADTATPELNPNTPYKNMLAQADSGSGISGASDADASAASTEETSPKEEADAKPKKAAKKKSSWWPFGRKESTAKTTDSKKKKGKTDDTGADTLPADAGADAAPLTAGADSAPLDGHKDPAATMKPAREGGEAAAVAATSTADAAGSDTRLRQMQETLPAEITERARRGESRIKDLLDKAQAIKSRQSERDKEAQDEARKEQERGIEQERESRRLRAMAAAGQLPEEDTTAPAEEGAPAGGKSSKIQALLARKEELIAEGAPQDRLDRLDAQISALKRQDGAPAKKSKTKKEKTELAKKPKSKSSSKAAKTGKTKTKKEKTAKAPAAGGDDPSAPPLPMDSAPEPYPTGPGEEPAATPKKKKKAKKSADAAPAAGSDAPAVPAEGSEFKLDPPAGGGNTGL